MKKSTQQLEAYLKEIEEKLECLKKELAISQANENEYRRKLVDAVGEKRLLQARVEELEEELAKVRGRKVDSRPEVLIRIENIFDDAIAASGQTEQLKASPNDPPVPEPKPQPQPQPKKGFGARLKAVQEDDNDVTEFNDDYDDGSDADYDEPEDEVDEEDDGGLTFL